mgnify:CR=1 FL=1
MRVTPPVIVDEALGHMVGLICLEFPRAGAGQLTPANMPGEAVIVPVTPPNSARSQELQYPLLAPDTEDRFVILRRHDLQTVAETPIWVTKSCLCQNPCFSEHGQPRPRHADPVIYYQVPLEYWESTLQQVTFLYDFDFHPQPPRTSDLEGRLSRPFAVFTALPHDAIVDQRFFPSDVAAVDARRRDHEREYLQRGRTLMTMRTMWTSLDATSTLTD